MKSLRLAPWALVVALMTLGPAGAEDVKADEPARLNRGREALRAMDCARCHGRNYDGWAAASLIAAVREGSRERFEVIVLDGNPGRGMPGYRSQPFVVNELDSIYRYLVARAGVGVSADHPQPAAPPRREPE